MRPGGGAAKGAAFERQGCRDFSKWMSGGLHDDLFWRTAMSGGLATLKLLHGKTNRTQAGDMMAIHSSGEPLTDRFLIEFKFRRSLKLDSFYTGVKGGVAEYWEKCCEQAEQHGRMPLMVAKQNRMPAFISLNQEGYASFNLGLTAFAHFYYHNAYLVWYKDFFSYAKPPVRIVSS